MQRSLRSAGVVAALLAWSAAFVLRNWTFLEGRRAYLLLDDAMISMAHARNLVEGHGLSWARWGPPVEGFSHPLWTLLMIPINALPLALGLRPLLVALLSAAALGANVVVVRRLVLRHFAGPARQLWMPAALLTAFYLPLDSWALLGMESGLQALLTTLAILLALDIVRDRRPRHTALCAVLAAAVLLRPDMLLLVALVVPWVVLRAPGGRARDWLPGAALFLVVNGAYLAFRWSYYGELLPNTYYLKMTGVPLAPRLMRGLAVFLPFCAPLLVLLVPLHALALARRRDFLILATPLVFFLYAIWVGGDAWEGSQVANRFCCFVVPLYFVALCGALNDRPALPDWVPSALTAAVLLVSNGLLFGDVAVRWRQAACLDRWSDGINTELHAREVVALNRLLPPEALVAVTWAGVSSYFTDFRLVDLGGYNEPWIAHKSVALGIEDAMAYRPGHIKADLRWALDHHRPDVVVSFWAEPGMKAEDELKARGYVRWHDVWALAGSRNVPP